MYQKGIKSTRKDTNQPEIKETELERLTISMRLKKTRLIKNA
jgi:hypothetical protein